MTNTAADYARQALSLLPPGLIWPEEETDPLFALFEALGEEGVELEERVEDLLREAFPNTATELLPEWESSVGLPNACQELAEALPQRRAAVAARVTFPGTASRAALTALAAVLGVAPITFEEFDYWHAGEFVGQPVPAQAHVFHLVIHAPTFSPVLAMGDVALADGPLASTDVAAFECTMREAVHADRTLSFIYDLEPVGWFPWSEVSPPGGGAGAGGGYVVPSA